MSTNLTANLVYGYYWEDQKEELNPPDSAWAHRENSCAFAITSNYRQNYSYPYVHHKELEIECYEGFPVEVLPEHFTKVTEQHKADLDYFCARYNIDLTEAKGPCWFLVGGLS